MLEIVNYISQARKFLVEAWEINPI